MPNLRYGFTPTPMSCGAFNIDEDSWQILAVACRDKWRVDGLQESHPINYYDVPIVFGEHPGRRSTILKQRQLFLSMS